VQVLQSRENCYELGRKWKKAVVTLFIFCAENENIINLEVEINGHYIVVVHNSFADPLPKRVSDYEMGSKWIKAAIT
jgi:hypothetical protein